MPQARDEAGNIWETDAQGNPLRLVSRGGSQGYTVPSNPQVVSQQQAREDRDNAAAGRDDTRTGIAVRGEGRDIDNFAFDHAKDLRDEFNKRPDVQDYRAAIKAYSTALKTAENPAGDLNLIYAFAKIMDPNSVVREGEQAAVAGGDSMFGQIQARLKKELGNNGTFRPEYRNQLRSELQNRIAELRDAYEGQRSQFEGFSQELGVDPLVVVGQDDGSRFYNDIFEYWKKQGVPVVSEGRDAQGNPLPSGARLPQGQPPAPPTGGGDYRDSYVGQGMSGINEGIASTIGAPIDLLTMGMNLVPQGINAIANTNIPRITNPVGGSQSIKDLMGSATIYDQSNDPNKQFLRRAGQSVGAATVPLMGGSGSAMKALQGVGVAAGGGVGAATAQRYFPNNPAAEFAGEVLGSGLTAGGLIGSGRRVAMRKAMEDVPTVPELKQQATNLYNTAESRGVTASPQQTTDLSQNLRAFLEKQGRITPDGQITEVYPKVKEAVRLTDGYAGMPMTATQMQPVRSVIADGLTSQDGSERYLAKKMTGIFDDWADPQAPELAQARNVASRYLNAEKLEQARELATANANKFSQSGFENALRQEYRALDRNAVRGKGRYGADLTAAIEAVNRGTPTSNAAQWLGRFAPTTPFGFLMNAGPSAAVGAAFGPQVGAGLSLGMAGLGTLGRAAGNALARKNADMAELVARNGGAITPPSLDLDSLQSLGLAFAGQQTPYLTEEERRRKSQGN